MRGEKVSENRVRKKKNRSEMRLKGPGNRADYSLI